MAVHAVEAQLGFNSLQLSKTQVAKGRFMGPRTHWQSTTMHVFALSEGGPISLHSRQVQLRVDKAHNDVDGQRPPKAAKNGIAFLP